MKDIFQHVIVSLEQPAIALSRERYTGHLKIKGYPMKGPSWAPWLTLPDILYDAASRTFLGISCNVPEHSIDYVQQLCSHLNPDVVRYNCPTNSSFRQLYGQDNAHRFEIVWGLDEPNTMEVAQLIEGEWYYAEGGYPRLPFVSNNLATLLSSDNIFSGSDHLVGFGLVDVNEVLDNHHLIMPNLYRVPQVTLGEEGVIEIPDL
jgi:hypothetical protein